MNGCSKATSRKTAVGACSLPVWLWGAPPCGGRWAGGSQEGKEHDPEASRAGPGSPTCDGGCLQAARTFGPLLGSPLHPCSLTRKCPFPINLPVKSVA